MQAALELECPVPGQAESERGLRPAGQDDRGDAVLLGDFEGARRLSLEEEVEGAVFRVSDGEGEERGREVARVARSFPQLRRHDGVREAKRQVVGWTLRVGRPVEADTRALGADRSLAEAFAVHGEGEALIGNTGVGLDVEDQSAVARGVDVETDDGVLSHPLETFALASLRIAAESFDEMGLGIGPAEDDGGTIRRAGREGEAIGEVVAPRRADGWRRTGRPTGPRRREGRPGSGQE
jgi:hypothetical protein